VAEVSGGSEFFPWLCSVELGSVFDLRRGGFSTQHHSWGLAVLQEDRMCGFTKVWVCTHTHRPPYVYERKRSKEIVSKVKNGVYIFKAINP
jgi:hypothetical protein